MLCILQPFFFSGSTKHLLREYKSRFIKEPSHTLPVTIYSWSAGWHTLWEAIINSLSDRPHWKRPTLIAAVYRQMYVCSKATCTDEDTQTQSQKMCPSWICISCIPAPIYADFLKYFISVIMTSASGFREKVCFSTVWIRHLTHYKIWFLCS